ncbi:MAG TPA: ATP-binding protein [Candidatus Desulfaltia sp.]|nr:ATP-binding protein [Candidatus Desulfaltia sp.]
MNRQDNELRIRRAEESRQQKAEEIGRHMADRLEKAVQDRLRELSADSSIVRKIHLTHSDLVFMGRIQDGELQMPWDGAGKQVLSSQDDRSGELILQAQHAEFSIKNLRQALSLLNQALSLADSASQKSFVRLQIGRILVKSGDEEEALRLYKEILDQSGDLTDEYGIPFSLYAADRLSGLSGDNGPILSRLEGLMRGSGWLPPAAFYFIRDITVQLEANAHGSLPSDKVNQLRQSVENELANLERIPALKAFVAGWISRRNSSSRANELSTWEAHGDVPWLVGVRAGFGGEAQYLFAFHGPEVLRSVIEKSGLTDTFPGSCLIVTGPGAEGIPPGSSFQGFRLHFEETGISAWSSSSLPFPILYWSILILVIGFTGFGMYLLWRDVRRELALADMKSHFAASVSHELKTPLTAIRMFAEALAMGVQSQPEAQQEYLRTIISESERLSRLLNNVLDYSKIEQGTRTYRFEPLSLEDVIRAAAKAMVFSIGQKGFSLQIEADKGLPQVQADKDALEQAVLNLLDNAVKYSGKNRELRLRLYRREKSICIDVIDFGIGIADENKTRIFGKFFRAPGSENQRIPGTGLGLTIVSHIAEAHGGRVEVLSRPGEGSTFSIILPVEEE